LVNEDFLDDIVFQLNRDDHRVILLLFKAMEVVVCEGYGGHAASVVGVGDIVDGLYMAEVFLTDEVDPPLPKPLEMVLMVSSSGGSVGVILV